MSCLNITDSKEKINSQTSSNMAYFMKDDVNDEVFNGIPKILIPFDEVVNWDGVLKSSDSLKGDHATHL